MRSYIAAPADACESLRTSQFAASISNSLPPWDAPVSLNGVNSLNDRQVEIMWDRRGALRDSGGKVEVLSGRKGALY